MPRRSIDYSTPGNLKKIDIKTGKVIEAPPLPVICANFRHFRIASGMEQKEIAEQIGVFKNAISNWENGRARPDINLIPAICRVLHITPYELLGMPDESSAMDSRSKNLLKDYNKLDIKYKKHVDTVIQSLLMIQEQEQIPDLHEIELIPVRLAAGPSANFDDITNTETIYLHDSEYLTRADCLFSVNGDSMEPGFHNGDYVYVERFPKATPLSFGEIGAFCVGNETYIKQYEDDGLHSLNSAYPTMRFDEESAPVFVIGRVLGVVEPEQIATPEEIELFCKYQ